MKTTARNAMPLARAAATLAAVIFALIVGTGTHAQPPTAAAAGSVRQCQFIEGTLVPRLVMGVRRVNDAEFDALPVRAEKAPDGPVVAEARLFRPYYVVDRRLDDQQEGWLLIQDDYTVSKPLGWVPERHVEPFRSRYAYTFAPSDRDHPADLHDSSKDGYERLLAQMKGDPDAGRELVVVRERQGSAAWNPAKIDDIVPFIELRVPTDAIEKEYPDTTPTHRFGIPLENRLVHMGAVCGGPVDRERLASLRKQDDVQAGLEMLFVVDETESMRPFFGGVADVIEKAGDAAAKGGATDDKAKPARIAVSYYTDGPPGTRVSATPLAPIPGETVALALAAEVRRHSDKLPPGDYAFPPERMLEGLRDSIVQAGFTAGSDAFVAVVGDTGHEPADGAEKEKLIDEIAGLVGKHGLHVFFAHVGRRQTEYDMLFKKDADAVRTQAEAKGVPPGRIVYQPADANTLADEIGRAQERAARLRRERLRQIERIESRTPHTEPGPKLLQQLEAVGIPRQRFDELHLQYFVPARGWLFHPIAGPAAAQGAPQFRELFFLAPAEREALRELFAHVQGRLTKGGPIDHTAAVTTFAATLAKASRTPALETKVVADWKRIPEVQRSLGVFLEDVFGLRLKAALPYPAEASSQQIATAEAIRTLDERVGRLARAFVDGGPAAVWFDAATLVP